MGRMRRDLLALLYARMHEHSSDDLERCILALSGTRVVLACRLITGSAALLVWGAASALLKLQVEARAGEQRQRRQAADATVGSASQRVLSMQCL